jgi:putative ABC transport system ATP-binding protein
MANEPFIICDGLVKIYKVANLEVFALQGLELVVPRGELLGIVGASGSGKSTLMNILGGLDRPSAGRVWVDGFDLLKMSDNDLDHYRRSKVGFVWQQGARNLIPYLSALENVRLPLTLSGKSTNKDYKRADETLEIVGLGDRRHHRLVEMSGGEQQRVAIAVALANQPTMLLADEPTGEVDTTTAAGIFKVFQDLNSNFGITTIIVSHDAGIARHVQRVVAIRDGKTSSETVRQMVFVQTADTNGGEQVAPQEEEVFEEVVLLDAAGRLQVPRDYLDQYNIKRRVHLEPVDGGILIRPARTAARDHQAPGQATSEDVLIPTEKPRGIKALLQRIRPGRGRRS